MTTPRDPSLDDTASPDTTASTRTGSPGSTSPDDAEKLRRLRRTKAMATGLLVVAALVVAVMVPGGDEGWRGYVIAGAEAAMVGALADWFAVTALFRHPLGIPIPHTAIVQRRKDDIGRGLGTFVESNFLTRELVTDRLTAARPAERLATWLVTPGHAQIVGRQVGAAARGLTGVLEDPSIGSNLERVATERLRRVQVAPLVGRAMRTAIESGHHTEVVSSAIRELSRTLDASEEELRHHVWTQSPKWVPKGVDNAVFDRAFDTVQSLLRTIAADPDHEIRQHLDARLATWSDELRTSPELISQVQAAMGRILDLPEVRSRLASLGERLVEDLLDSAAEPDGELRGRIEDAALRLGERLSSDPELAAKVDGWIADAVGYVAEQMKGEVGSLISSTVERWDATETGQRIELQVGRDLQFIRINGTVVGALAGTVIHALVQLAT
ncbi:MAG: DUF445 domain-containing protein [Actinomycetota bacterium]|nr:DUF445 domain-containing protein [Actinomycetota bacterium]